MATWAELMVARARRWIWGGVRLNMGRCEVKGWGMHVRRGVGTSLRRHYASAGKSASSNVIQFDPDAVHVDQIV